MTRDMPTLAATPITAEELARLSVPGKSLELVRGQLVVREPPGSWHGMVQANLTRIVADFVHRHGLGLVFGQDTGFRIRTDPDTVRGADLAFVASERAALIPRRGYAALSPDLVAEILSPGDRPGEVLVKVGDWLDTGTRLVWVIDADRGEARVHRADGSLAIVAGDGALDGEDVLPGLTCPLRDVLG